MKHTQIIEVAQRYRQQLPPAEEFTKHEEVPTLLEQLKHCAYMCDKIVSGGLSKDKAMRWLCFIQGVLWSQGRKDIPSMKNDNRTQKPTPKPPVSPPPPVEGGYMIG